MSIDQIGGHDMETGMQKAVSPAQTRTLGDYILYGVLGLVGATGVYATYDTYRRDSFFRDAALTRSIEVCARNAQFTPDICTSPQFAQTVEAMKYGFVMKGLTQADTRAMTLEGLQQLVAEYVKEMVGTSWLDRKSLPQKEKGETINRLLAENNK